MGTSEYPREVRRGKLDAVSTGKFDLLPFSLTKPLDEDDIVSKILDISIYLTVPRRDVHRNNF